MAKTFDNISEASATNYLFLFAQRTLALQNEPPTPPPLNALGLPCNGLCLLWKWVHKQKQKRPIEPEASEAAAADATVGKTAATCGDGDGGGDGGGGGRDGGGGGGGKDVGSGREGNDSGDEAEGEGGGGGGGKGEDGGGKDEGGGDEGEDDGAGTEVAKQKKATDEPHSSAVEDGQGEEKEKTFAQKIAPLAKKITKYINDHQDDAAQEDRWRTTMKRETMKRFREQREATDTQGEAIAEVRRAIDQQREATAEVHRLIVKIGNSLSLASGAVGVTNQVGAEMENLEC